MSSKRLEYMQPMLQNAGGHGMPPKSRRSCRFYYLQGLLRVHCDSLGCVQSGLSPRFWFYAGFCSCLLPSSVLCFYFTEECSFTWTYLLGIKAVLRLLDGGGV